MVDSKIARIRTEVPFFVIYQHTRTCEMLNNAK